MTNVESRMTKECRMTTPEFVAQRDRILFSSFRLRHYFVIRPSDFVIF